MSFSASQEPEAKIKLKLRKGSMYSLEGKKCDSEYFQ